MKCKKCGSVLNENDAFCSNCGNTIHPYENNRKYKIKLIVFVLIYISMFVFPLITIFREAMSLEDTNFIMLFNSKIFIICIVLIIVELLINIYLRTEYPSSNLIEVLLIISFISIVLFIGLLLLVNFIDSLCSSCEGFY